MVGFVRSEAAAIFEKAIRIQPHSGLYYNLAVTYVKRQLYQEAIEPYQAAVKLNPQYAAAHHGLAVCYYYLEDKKLSKKHALLAKKMGFDVPNELLQ